MQTEDDVTSAGVIEGTVIEVSEVVVEPVVAASAPSPLVFDLRAPEPPSAPRAETPPVAAPAPPQRSERVEAAPAPRAGGPLAGRVAVVTGGSGPVGRAITIGLAHAGARVCVIGRDLAELRQTVALAGGEAAVLFLQCDVGSVSEIEGVVDFIERFDRPVDILVHAEGVQVRGGVEHGSVNDLDEQYLVNVRGPYVISQKLLARLRSGGGHVVFLNAAPGAVDPVEFGQFAVTSHGVRALADTLREEVRGSGIRVTSISSDPVVEAGVSGGDEAAGLLPSDVADSVLHAVQVPAQVEVTDISLRRREVASAADSIG
ncbi:MAG: SDR family oxidoreductase [Acidimicrobiales bacterium]